MKNSNSNLVEEWEIQTIEEGAGVKSVHLISMCFCGNFLKEFVTAFSRFSQVTCRLCGHDKLVPKDILTKAVAERSRILSESAEFRVKHGGSGLFIPE